MTELKTLRWGDNTGLSGGLHILVREVEEDFTVGGDLKISAKRDFTAGFEGGGRGHT